VLESATFVAPRFLSSHTLLDAKSYGKLTVKLPLGNKQKFTNFAIANKAFKDSRNWWW
jgi:hypothetical protein